MARMLGDATCRSNHGRHPATSPQLPSEAVGLGAVLQQGRQAGELRSSQPAAGPRRGAMTETFRAAFPATLHPLADRAFADPQGRRDLALSPPLLFEAPGLQASSVLPVMR
jgi:hypothetical protein